ncbi:MAG: hypothetical protein HY455_03300 [Parcubacteria group bacterium]|nr:hypothetical protein [Parcubacteria group bacterium]
MQRWFRFFFGSRVRAGTTTLALIVLGAIHYFAPGTLTQIAVGTVDELGPLLNMVLVYGIAFALLIWAFRLLLRPFTGKRGKSS